MAVLPNPLQFGKIPSDEMLRISVSGGLVDGWLIHNKYL